MPVGSRGDVRCEHTRGRDDRRDTHCDSRLNATSAACNQGGEDRADVRKGEKRRLQKGHKETNMHRVCHSDTQRAAR